MVVFLIVVVVEKDFEKTSAHDKKIMKNYSACQEIKGHRAELIFCPEDMFKAVWFEWQSFTSDKIH